MNRAKKSFGVLKSYRRDRRDRLAAKRLDRFDIGDYSGAA
jgi:hypothetical protein